MSLEHFPVTFISTLFRNRSMFWLDIHDELLCQEVIVLQPYMSRPSKKERGNDLSRIADSLDSIDNPQFHVNQGQYEHDLI